MRLVDLEDILVDIELSAMDMDTKEDIEECDYGRYMVTEIIGAEDDCITVLCEEL